MNKFIGFAAALVAAIGATLATPALSDAGFRGVRGCYVGGHHYSSHIWYGGRTIYNCYTPVVPYYRTYCPPVVAPGCTYNYSPICDNTVQVHVVVPAAAKVWFNNADTQQVGMDRVFTSPPLTPGFDYTYEVKAQWLDQTGNMVSQTRQVTIRANSTVDVNFLQPA